MVVKEIVDLGHELYNGMPNLGADIVAFWRTENYETTRQQSEGKVAFESRMMLMSEHCRTHLDAPYHWDEHGRTVDQIPLENLVLPGYLMDFSAKKAREAITPEDLAAEERRIGRPVTSGLAVLAWTGADQQWGKEGFKMERPYLPTESAAWLVE